MAGWCLAGPPQAANTAANTAENVETQRAGRFRDNVKPVLARYCFDCHANGEKSGGVELDKFNTDAELLTNRDLWFKVLKYVRSDVMPPSQESHPSAQQKRAILDWIKADVFLIDPARPNPGRVTVHRLNRAEYQNTIRDLMGVDFDAMREFPADDTGFGFDNASDVLTLSPMLLEKYLTAADSIVTRSVPTVPYVMAEQTIPGLRFTAKAIEDAPAANPADRRPQNRGSGNRRRQPATYLPLSYYKPASASYTVHIEKEGKYQLTINLTSKGDIIGPGGFDTNKARVAFTADGTEVFRDDYGWNDRREFHKQVEVVWKPGPHKLQIDLTPLTPGVKQTGHLELRLDNLVVRGPVDHREWVRPPNYARFFPENTPVDAAGRKAAARKLLDQFVLRAFRRPADDEMVSRLVDLAESVWSDPNNTYEQGIAKAITAALCSPRFLYREEQTLPAEAGQAPLIDEYSLATRLSYCLWASMPDDELLALAGKNELRKNLHVQVRRMLADSRSAAFTENFTGQWLEARDVVSVPIDVRRVVGRDQFRRFKNLDGDGNRQTRIDLEREVSSYFDYILRNDRDIIEFVSSDYTFLNERLANYYGIPDVQGDEIRKVQLPPHSPRGGILTMGATLMVTSNPTRTSPVKRGLFILDNVLGFPPPPPPPGVPPLEQAHGNFKDRIPTLREQLAVHRESPQCASCHNRMDPLGLALENFNALGLWRTKEHGSDIDSSGVLITGEKFKTIQDLKAILAGNDRRIDFYRCLTEKVLTYALGRGMDYQDVGTIDQIVATLDRQNGHFSALLMGVIDSAAFQRKQTGDTMEPLATAAQ